MKRITLLLATAAVLSSCYSEPELVTPSAKQVEWADAEIGVMFHFDMPVFVPEYNFRNWGTNPDLSEFNPEQLNTDQWIENGKMVETQLNELWGNYGDLFEVWFDGGVLQKELLGCDVPEIAHRLQPDAVKFGTPEGFDNRIRWVGNEEGFSPDPCWATCDTGESDIKFGGEPFANNWNAREADFTLRWNSSFQGGWFWHRDEDEDDKMS